MAWQCAMGTECCCSPTTETEFNTMSIKTSIPGLSNDVFFGLSDVDGDSVTHAVDFGQTFEVVLEARGEGRRIGLGVSPHGSGFGPLRVAVVEALGEVAAWNGQHPDQCVRVNDYLLE
eukprot:5445129-Amphidinium_carterae.1